MMSGRPGRILRTVSAAGLLAAALAIPLACGPEGRDFDVVWIVLDAAGARHLSYLGERRPTTPGIDALARDPRSLVCTRAYAQWPSTLGSAGSFLTGLYPPPDEIPFALATPTVASRLRGAGIRTAALSENPFVSAGRGFDAGFDVFRQVGAAGDGPLAQAGRNSAKTVDRALDWIDREQPPRLFLYLHLLPPHAPYRAPPPHAERFSGASGYAGPFDGSVPRLLAVFSGAASAAPDDLEHLHALYDENLAFADAQVGRLVDGLRERGRLERTLLIVSADHGEAFGEHGVILHGTSLFEEEIHVPLLIRLPRGVARTGGRVDRPVELVDVVPTILDVLDLPADGLPGRSILREPAPRAVARAWLLRDGVQTHAEIGPAIKEIRATDGKAMAFDLARDPLESRPLEVAERRSREDPETRLPTFRWVEKPIDPKVVRQLEALGYVEESP